MSKVILVGEQLHKKASHEAIDRDIPLRQLADDALREYLQKQDE